MKLDLRAALLEANLRQYAAAMEQAEEPAYSPKYQRSCLRMLSNPTAWAKRFARPLWKKTLRTAACILLAFTLALGTLMGVNPTVRAAVMNWFREIRDGVVSYTSKEIPEQLTPSVWRPTWIPEGYVLREVWTTESQVTWVFTEPESRDRLRVMCLIPGGQISADTGIPDIQPVSTTIQGNPAAYYAGAHGDQLIWETPEGYLFWISGNGDGDQAVLEKVGSSMMPYDADAPAFAPTWLPEGHSTCFAFPGVGQRELLRNGDALTFRYVTDPICPWERDESREGTPVTVQGEEGMLWEATIPEGREESTVETGSIVISSGTSHGVEEAGVLLWTDRETNTAFQLQGILPREELLRIAESVTACEPAIPSGKPGRTDVASGTAQAGGETDPATP